MDLQHFLTGEPVELQQMLDARERRVSIQARLQKQFQLPLISFTLNIAGPVKVFPLAARTFEEGIKLIRCQCRAWEIPILYTKEVRESTGNTCYLIAKAPAETVKRALMDLEQRTSLGRLFDIDILDADGRKLSRTELGAPERRCLLCGRPAYVCGRARAHPMGEILKRTVSIMRDYFAEQYADRTARVAVRALLYEVQATPKPGLVDRHNSGAHRDMNVFTFETSALALLPYFKTFVAAGITHSEHQPEALLEDLRPIGLQAEVSMFQATGEVNTHKGILFSMGILCAALGICFGREASPTRQVIQGLCRQIAAPLCADFTNITGENAVSHGEKQFAAYGVRGIRGEAVSGFPALFRAALPRLDHLLADGYSLNDAGVLTLVSAIAETEDTNLIARSSYERTLLIRRRLRELIDDGLAQRDYLTILEQLDQEFIAEGISPGGSADILALAYFIRFLEQEGLMPLPPSMK